ncbi:hypothetical protein B0H17DRAFT_948712, partial [Mycena rosella]
EGLLLEPHNGILLDLWLTLATWHAYTKLRLYSSSTVQHFTSATTELGMQARRFIRTTCEAFFFSALAGTPLPLTLYPKFESRSPLAATYKYHLLGDYPEAITRLGTTDSYSTQIVRFFAFVCLEPF